MGHVHPSTPAERAQSAAIRLAQQGEYGLNSRISRDHGVACPPLYAWREQEQQALVQQLQQLLEDTLPQLLRFMPQVEQVQHAVRAVLSAKQQALVG